MVGVRRIQKQTAVQMALESLREYILNEEERQDLKLPSETELASQLGVSRLTVREALTVLEKEGYITRNQGSSTTITSFATRLTSRIEDARELGRLIRDNGYESSVDELSHSWVKADIITMDKLSVDEDEEILVIEKRFLADKQPAAFCIDRIPRKYFSSTEITKNDIEKSIFSLVEKLCNCQLTHDVIEIIPSVADEKLSRLFNIKKGTPLLRVDTVQYTKKGYPIMYNTEY